MQLSYEEIFKYTDVFNPVSLQTLHAAGKLAGLSPEKTLIELGCGKGFPSLFWASAFGVRVEGVDIGQTYVDYANARAKLLNLSDRAQFFCRDLKDFLPSKKYDVISSLGIEPEAYGGRARAFDFFKSMLNKEGVIIYGEPVWTKKPVAPEVLKSLRCTNESFLTIPEMDQLMQGWKLQVLGSFVVSKMDWELYVQSPLRSLQETIQQNNELAGEAQAALEGFRMEYEAAGGHWDDVLWVVKPSER